MKITFIACRNRPIRIDPTEIDPAADYTRQWCIREAIRDDPSLTPAAAAALYREAAIAARAGGF